MKPYQPAVGSWSVIPQNFAIHLLTDEPLFNLPKVGGLKSELSNCTWVNQYPEFLEALKRAAIQLYTKEPVADLIRINTEWLLFTCTRRNNIQPPPFCGRWARTTTIMRRSNKPAFSFVYMVYVVYMIWKFLLNGEVSGFLI